MNNEQALKIFQDLINASIKAGLFADMDNVGKAMMAYQVLSTGVEIPVTDPKLNGAVTAT